MLLMRIVTTLAVLLSLIAPSAAQPPRAEDAETKAIRQTALDYIEGWYEGNVERMTRALHPALVKRIIVNDRGVSRLDDMGASKLIAGVRSGYGKETPKDKQLKEVTILDRFENAAAVKIVASDWIDYLQVGKVDGRWVIVNVLWERKPETQPKPKK
jgi:hypothetical protein